MKNIISVFCILFVSITVFSQNTKRKIILKDKETHEVLPAAHIKLISTATNSTTQFSTDINGIAHINVSTGDILLSTYVGYKPSSDTIRSLSDTTIIYLESDIFMTEQIVVTATRSEKTLANAPVITQLITSKQIEQLGIESVDQVLAVEIPGVEFNRRGTSMDVNIQGLEARNILFLINGERIAGETRGNIDYSMLNTSDAARIEIIKGASSALYGSQAMGAVVNIIEKEVQKNFHADIFAKYTSFNQINYPDLSKSDDQYSFKRNTDLPNLNLFSNIHFKIKKLSSKTNFAFNTSDAYELTDKKEFIKEFHNIDTTIVEQPGTTQIEGGKDYLIKQQFTYHLNDNWKFKARASYFNRHKYDLYREDKKHEAFDSYSAGANATYTKNRSTTILSLHTDTYNKYDYLEKRDERILNYTDKIFNPRIMNHFFINEQHELTSGFEYLYQSLLTDMFVYGELIDQNSSSLVFFIQDDWNINSKANITAGFRAEYNSSFGSRLTPKLSAMYKILPFTLRLNYGSGYRAPTLKELYMEWDHLGMFIIKGSEDLQAETNQYVSVSAELNKSWINTSISVYNNSFKNKIEGQWKDNQTIYQYQNIDKSRLSGVDLLAKIKISPSWFIRGGYSYLYDKNFEEGIRLSSASPHTANIQFEYLFKRNNYQLNVNLLGKYIGPKEFDVYNEIEFRGELTDAYYTSRYDGYSIWRLSINQNLYQSLQLVIGVNNLFDYSADYITFNTSITPGRRYFISLKANLEDLYQHFK